MINISLAKAFQEIDERILENIRDGLLLGLGSGSTVRQFVNSLGRYVAERSLNVSVIPSSLQIQLAAEEAGLRITDLTYIQRIDLTVDGADQIDRDRNMIKGGGGALLREKVLINSSTKTIILADERKFVKKLSGHVPVEVFRYARTLVPNKLEKLGGKPRLRVLDKGYPYITENGNVIFDTDFGVIRKPAELERTVRLIAGVAECGIFTSHIDLIYKANEDGTVDTIR